MQAPSAKRVQLGLNLAETPADPRVTPATGMCTHRVGLPDLLSVDGDVAGWLRSAYERAGWPAGSICVFDPVAKLLVVGDAMGTPGGRPTLPSANFTTNMDQAKQSVVKLGGLTFETLLVGHGEPITSGASALVAELGRTG